MKKTFPFITIIFLLIAAILLPACNRVGSALNGSGNIIDHDIKITDFDSLNVKGAFELEISRAKSYRVTISTDENLLSRVQVFLERKTLKLSIEAPATFFPSSLKVKIALPQISGINLSGAAKATISGFNSTDLTLFLAGGSSLNGSLEAATPRVYLSEASQLTLKGEGTRLELEAKGGSKVDLGEFSVVSAQVKLKDASEATLDVIGRFDVNLSSASKIFYLGNPIITDASISGDSTMTRK